MTQFYVSIFHGYADFEKVMSKMLFLDFKYIDGTYTFKKIHKGNIKDEKRLQNSTEFFCLIKEVCSLDFDAINLCKKNIDNRVQK